MRGKVTTSRLRHREQILSRGTRGLAIVAGLLSGAAVILAFGGGSLFLVSVLSLLILGAALQSWSPGPGKYLMRLGAFISTAFVVLMVLRTIVEFARMVLRYHDFNIVAIFVVFVAAVVFLFWCDVVLLLELRNARYAEYRADLQFPRVGDWAVWMIALALTPLAGSFGLGVFAMHQLHGLQRILSSAIAVVIVVGVAWFDAALVLDACRRFRLPRAHKQGDADGI